MFVVPDFLEFRDMSNVLFDCSERQRMWLNVVVSNAPNWSVETDILVSTDVLVYLG